MREGGRGRNFVAPRTVLICLLLAWSRFAFALNPALDVSQYAHFSWKIRDGFFKSAINAIAQTPDGYLWLGSEFGLLRFDGVRAVDSPLNQQLPSTRIISLLTTADGALWIGTSKGLAVWRGGKLSQYAALTGLAAAALLQDREGLLWAGAIGASGRLCAIQNDSVRCYGEDGRFGSGVLSLYESGGSLWVGASTGLWRWKPDPPKLYSMDPIPEARSLVEGDNGALWIATGHGLLQLGDGQSKAHPSPVAGLPSPPARMLRDREGGMWIGMAQQGLMHIHQGVSEVFGPPDGLSGHGAYSLFEDREGTIWVATASGLDRFHDVTVATISARQGLSDDRAGAVLAAGDGSIWISAFGVLNRWLRGRITIYRERQANRTAGIRDGTGGGLPDHGVGSLFQDARGRVWIQTTDGFGYVENDRLHYIEGVPGGFSHAIAEDAGGNLWIANQDRGLIRVSSDSQVQVSPWDGLARGDYATAIAPDPLQGGLWLGFRQSGLLYRQDGQIRKSYTAADGLGDGGITELRFDRDGTLWAATGGGLSRLKSGRVTTLTQKNGLPCNTVHWAMEDDDHAFWLYMSCGLVHIERPELDAWIASPNRTLKTTVFDASDGVRTRPTAGGYVPRVAKSPDGKLWFATSDGVSVVDPRHLAFNRLPPPVHIEQITADRKIYDPTTSTHLPALIRDLRIDYTALSLAAPEKVKFRYKLEGHDTDWQEAGTRRQAFYNDLRPRKYRFRVIACNNSGVWNETGAALDFSIAPAYYQSTWFLAACIVAALATLAAAYQLRLQYVKRQFNIRLEERVNERTRLARDLHDTLLQSIQGVLMKLSVVPHRIPDHPDVQETLETIVEQARQAVTEGRDAVQELRSSTVVTNNLARAMYTVGEELAAAHAGPGCPEFRLHVEGTTRDLAAIVRDEVHRIACEAVRNAFRHAAASRIEVEIAYDRRQFRLRVCDNGKGIDPAILEAGGREGHHGLPGMRERARLAGGKLAVRSKLGAGTEAELAIPAAFAYRDAAGDKEPAAS